MEKNKIKRTLYATPCWQVLGYLMQNPDIIVRGVKLVKALPLISKSAIYESVRQLEKIGVLIRDDDSGGYRMCLDSNNMWLRYMMIADNLVRLQSLVNRLSEYASKLILFGSRAKGDFTSESDYDIFVVSGQADNIRRIANRDPLSDQIQLLIKTPEEWLDLHRTDPVLYQTLHEGIVLWEQK